MPSHPSSSILFNCVILRATAGLALLSLLSTTGCASFPGGSAPSLHEEIRSITMAPPLDQVHWGVLVQDAETGRVLYDWNGHRKFVPASNMKLLSTATALSLLGPDFRFQTEVWGTAPLDSGGGLPGDLVFLPSGDPTLSERFYPRAEAPLDSVAQALWDGGLRHVEGSLVMEASSWDSTTVPGSWMVGNLNSSSGATPAPLGIQEGVIVLEISAGERAGAPAQTRWWPETPRDFFSASFVTVHPDSTLQRVTDWAPESRRLLVSGRIPAGQVDTLYVAQRDPMQVASGALLSALERRGIRIEGGFRVNWNREATFQPHGHPGASRLHTLSSPPLLQIVEAILEPSQNWMTEQLVHALGRELGEEGSWQEGFEVQRTFLAEEVGVDTLDLHFRDGSGLSAYNLVTPRALVALLDFMRRSPQGQAYRQALAEPGEEEGTLRNRLDGLDGRIFAKTGTISHVNSLSGYLITEGGRELIFSVLTNGSGLSSSVVRRGIDGVVRTIATLGG